MKKRVFNQNLGHSESRWNLLTTSKIKFEDFDDKAEFLLPPSNLVLI